MTAAICRVVSALSLSALSACSQEVEFSPAVQLGPPISSAAPTVLCSSSPHVVRLRGTTVGCFGGVNHEVEFERTDSGAWLHADPHGRSLTGEEAEAVIDQLERTLREPERSSGGSSTTLWEADLEVICGNSVEAARWSTYEVDGDMYRDFDLPVDPTTLESFVRASALVHLADRLAEYTNASGAGTVAVVVPVSFPQTPTGPDLGILLKNEISCPPGQARFGGGPLSEKAGCFFRCNSNADCSPVNGRISTCRLWGVQSHEAEPENPINTCTP
jgi:hypothetical protein